MIEERLPDVKDVCVCVQSCQSRDGYIYILFRPTFHAQQPFHTKLDSNKSIIHERL